MYHFDRQEKLKHHDGSKGVSVPLKDWEVPELALLYRHCIKPPAGNSRCASEELPSSICSVGRRIYAPNSDTQLDALSLLFSPVS